MAQFWGIQTIPEVICSSGGIGRRKGLDSKEELNVLSKRWTKNVL